MENDETKINELINEVEEEERNEEKIKEITTYLSNLEISNAYNNVKFFCEHIQPFFYDKYKLFWFWNQTMYKWEMVDEIDLINEIGSHLKIKGQIVNSGTINKYLRCFEQIGREKHPKEPNKDWIQFKDKIFDIKEKKTFSASPKYFFCNPLPWEIGKSKETPTIDKLFSQWSPGYEELLFEILAYCCYPDYPIHRIFCFIGTGRNGKSKFLQLLEKFVGSDNVCSTELDCLIDNRFESSKLYKKLICFMAETNFGNITRTAKIKALTGQDRTGLEIKNKAGFDFINYSKIIIGSNGLPMSTDNSDGWHRRWVITPFPNEFQEGKDIIDTIPDIEFSNMANKVIERLPILLERGKFVKEGSIDDRKKNYQIHSNPIPQFLKDFCVMDANTETRFDEVYNAYSAYMQVIKKRVLNKFNFDKQILAEGFECEKLNKKEEDVWRSSKFIIGLKLIDNWRDVINKLSSIRSPRSTTLDSYIEKIPDESRGTNGTSGTIEEEDVV